MGTYINPGNAAFASIVADDYVDKTGLIELVNEVAGTPRKLVCVTRPRRFGKSFAAQSLVAYYDCSCDSHSLFEGLDVARSTDYERHLNAYNVVRLDMTEFVIESGGNVAPLVEERLMAELATEFPDVEPGGWLTDALLGVVRATGRKFVFVIDEWDAPIRENAHDEAAKESWINLLRLLFKNASFTGEAVEIAYITGILPVKHYGTQSALNDFDEFTMVQPARYARYVGFTKGEVEALAARYGMSMDDLRHWYDGYELPGVGHVYAPFSVMRACQRGQIGSYWTSSEIYESLRIYIDMDFDQLQGTVTQLLGGDKVRVNLLSFSNDMADVRNADDVLTLLVHLGYLAYDCETGFVHVPNEEIRAEFRVAIGESRHSEIARIVKGSEALLRASWALDGDAVADAVQHAHDYGCAPLYYNDEQALRAVVKAAYIAAVDHYEIIEELPGGRGFADIAFLPKRRSQAPAMVVELKWDKPAETALDQIRSRDYLAPLRDLKVPVLLVGITYDSETKSHTCAIEELR
ncbi:MAG: AAA family ATPase [Eggerthellaceae bacterium]|nr:AAA family ATPase [Eggerthellaceae bacterium]